MSRLVLDCSVAVAWCFADEATDASEAILGRVRQDGAAVPALWHLEVGNALLPAAANAAGVATVAG